MAGVGNQQIINGQSYTMYSPQWYDAQQQDEIRRAGVAGTAKGTYGANSINALSPSLTGLLSAVNQGSSRPLY